MKRELIIVELNRNKLITGLFFFVMILLSSCQEVKKEYYDNGKLMTKYQVKNNQFHGYYREYYQNGNIKEEAFYENGELEGMKKVYYPNGQLDWKAYFEDNKENGIYKDYSEEGVLLVECHFKKGKQHGKIKLYYPDEKLKKEVDFKNGLEHGEYKSFYKNGKLAFYAFTDSNKTVFYQEFNENGNIEDEYRHAAIEFEKDTINLGELCKAKIKIHGPLLKNVKATIELSDSNLTRVPLKKEIEIKNNTYTCKVSPRC